MASSAREGWDEYGRWRSVSVSLGVTRRMQAVAGSEAIRGGLSVKSALPECRMSRGEAIAYDGDAIETRHIG